MPKKVLSFAIAAALVCALCVSVCAKGDGPKEPAEASAPPAAKKEVNEKLKADVAKLVTDAKAGKLKLPKEHFPQPTRNNLSTGAKIAIFAGIAGAIVFIILWYTTGPGSD